MESSQAKADELPKKSPARVGEEKRVCVCFYAGWAGWKRGAENWSIGHSIFLSPVVMIKAGPGGLHNARYTSLR